MDMDVVDFARQIIRMQNRIDHLEQENERLREYEAERAAEDRRCIDSDRQEIGNIVLAVLANCSAEK